MEKHYDLGEKYKNVIIELQKKAIELRLSNVGFELRNNNDKANARKYKNISIGLTRHKSKWKVTVSYIRYTLVRTREIPYEVVDTFRDLYNLSNDGVLEYDYTE